MFSKLLAGLAMFSVAGIASAAIFSEDFESYGDGELNGLGNWATVNGLPLNATGHLPTRILNGIFAPGAADFHYASNPVSLVGEGGIITLSFDAFGLVADISDGVFSHNSGAGLGFNGTGLAAGWIAMNGGGWRFDVSALTGNPGDFEDVLGGMQSLASFEVVLDRSAGVVFGRWDFNGFSSGETAHFTLAPAAIDLLTHVVVQQDLRNPSVYTGIEVDNFLLDASAVSVPEPLTAILAMSAAGLGLRRLKSRRS